MAANATFFSNANHCKFEGLQINAYQNTQSPAFGDPLEILRQHRALEASHTSKTASSAAKCKPGTRIKAIRDITIWSDDRPISCGKSVLWVTGPAGAGKTCIMREVTQTCHRKRTLAGDYFFSTRVPGLDNEAPFVATIVSNLFETTPALQHPIRETIRSNPTIFEQSLEWQVEKLISDHSALIPPRILVVDGFDECRDPEQRKHLLRLLHSLVTPPHPFRVVIASRPEYDIRTAFDQPPLKSITKIVRLEDYETYGEIYQYLSDEFTRIRETHPAKEAISSEWPGQATLRGLTDKSSGIWAYPSTIIKYVDNPRRQPVKLLEHVLKPSPTATSEHPFAELDALYQAILDSPNIDIPLTKRLLHLIIEITRLQATALSGSSDFMNSLTQRILSVTTFEEFLRLEKGTVRITLCDLHSILSVTEDAKRPWIYFHHKSLEDYLCSPRAGNFYQSQADTHSDILSVCTHNLKLWDQEFSSPKANLRHVHDTLYYSCKAWLHLVMEEKCFPPSILDFDARSAWRCFAFAGLLPPDEEEFCDIVAYFHTATCREEAGCGRCCASFRRLLEYRETVWQAIYRQIGVPPTKALKNFEEAVQGLFTPLDLSLPTSVTRARLRPPPKPSFISRGTDFVRDPGPTFNSRTINIININHPTVVRDDASVPPVPPPPKASFGMDAIRDPGSTFDFPIINIDSTTVVRDDASVPPVPPPRKKKAGLSRLQFWTNS